MGFSLRRLRWLKRFVLYAFPSRQNAPTLFGTQNPSPDVAKVGTRLWSRDSAFFEKRRSRGTSDANPTGVSLRRLRWLKRFVLYAFPSRQNVPTLFGTQNPSPDVAKVDTRLWSRDSAGRGCSFFREAAKPWDFGCKSYCAVPKVSRKSDARVKVSPSPLGAWAPVQGSMHCPPPFPRIGSSDRVH